MFYKKTRIVMVASMLSVFVVAVIAVFAITTQDINYAPYENLFDILLLAPLIILLVYLGGYFIYSIVKTTQFFNVIALKNYEKLEQLKKIYPKINGKFLNTFVIISNCYLGKTDEFYNTLNNNETIKNLLIPYKLALDFLLDKEIDKSDLNQFIRQKKPYFGNVIKQISNLTTNDYEKAINDDVDFDDDFFKLTSCIVNIKAKKKLNKDCSKDIEIVKTISQRIKLNINID